METRVDYNVVIEQAWAQVKSNGQPAETGERVPAIELYPRDGDVIRHVVGDDWQDVPDGETGTVEAIFVDAAEPGQLRFTLRVLALTFFSPGHTKSTHYEASYTWSGPYLVHHHGDHHD